MPNFNCYELQKAIYEKLIGNSSLAAVINGIFNYPPQNPDYPFLTIGDIKIKDFPILGKTATDQELELHVWSREAGNRQAANIIEIIYGLLHNGIIEINEQTLLMMRFVSISIKLEDDGITYHGILILNVILVNS